MKPASSFAERHPVLRKVFMYGASRGVTETLLGFRGIVLASLLGPGAFGVWSLFRLTSQYAGLGGLGVHRGLEFEIVRSLAAAGDNAAHEADRVGETALGFLLVVFGPLAAIALAASILVPDPQLALGLRALAIGVLAEQLWLYVSLSIRARGELRRFARNELLNAGFQLLFGAGLAFAFGLPGAFAGFVIAGVVSVGLFARRVPLKPRWSPDRLARLIRVGFPMALLVLVTLLLGTVDRLVVVAFGGTTLLGFYAFAAALAVMANTGGWVVRTVVFPGVYRDATGTGTRRAIRYHVRQTLLPFAVVAPPLLGAVGILLGPLVVEWLPQYEMAVAPARVFILTGVASALASLATVPVLAAGRHRSVPAWAAVGVLLNIGCSMLALTRGLGLQGVAVGALLSQSFYSAAILRIMARTGGYGSPSRVVVAAIGPTLWCAAALIVVQRVTPMMSVGSALIGLGCFLGLSLPLAARLRKTARRIRWRAWPVTSGLPEP